MVRMIRFMQLMELLGRAVRAFLPWVGRLMIFMLSFIATTVVSFWGGVPRAVTTIANDWLDRAVAAGFPTRWDSRLYYVFWCLAFVMIIIGWVILSYLTVLAIQLIF